MKGWWSHEALDLGFRSLGSCSSNRNCDPPRSVSRGSASHTQMHKTTILMHKTTILTKRVLGCTALPQP